MLRIRPSWLVLAPLLAPVVAIFLPGCQRIDRIQDLPLAHAEAIKISEDARPARRLPVGQALRWKVSTSREARLEFSVGLAEDDSEPNVRAEFRITREANGASEILKTIRLTKEPRMQWTDVEVPWPAHRGPVSLLIEADSWIKGDPSTDPLDTPALVSEPVLVPERLPPDPPVVLVYMVDTLRADHLRCYGGATAPETSEFDRLAKEGLRVERMLAPASWTLPSHASFFTSTAVTTHRVVAESSRLGPELPTLAETYRSAGYRTLAVTNGGFVDSSFGLARGFERYLSIDIRRESVVQSVPRVIEFIRAHTKEPLFIFFHTFQVHEYQATHDFIPEKVPDRRNRAAGLRKRYDEGVQLADRALGLLRRGLIEVGVERRTLLVATSDHGEILDDRESLVEPNVFGHGHPYLREEELRVPFFLLNPSEPRAGARVAVTSTLLDVGPTLLRLSGLAIPSTFEGTCLDDLEKDSTASGKRLLLSLSPQLPAFCFEHGGKKLLLRPMQRMKNFWTGRPYATMPAIEGYDRGKDPGETSSLRIDQAFIEPFRTDLERLVPEVLPGTLIVRLPPATGAMGFRATVASRWTSVTTFGEADELPIAMSDGERVAEAMVPAASNSLWLALRPEQFGDGTELTLRFRSRTAVVANDGSRLPAGRSVLSWRRLSIPRKPAPGAVQIFAVPPGSAGAGAAGPPEETLDQLRSLGYVTPGGKRQAGDQKPSGRNGAVSDTVILLLEEGPP